MEWRNIEGMKSTEKMRSLKWHTDVGVSGANLGTLGCLWGEVASSTVLLFFLVIFFSNRVQRMEKKKRQSSPFQTHAKDVRIVLKKK